MSYDNIQPHAISASGVKLTPSSEINITCQIAAPRTSSIQQIQFLNIQWALTYIPSAIQADIVPTHIASLSCRRIFEPTHQDIAQPRFTYATVAIDNQRIQHVALWATDK